jgi:hypothetical protein
LWATVEPVTADSVPSNARDVPHGLGVVGMFAEVVALYPFGPMSRMIVVPGPPCIG